MADKKLIFTSDISDEDVKELVKAIREDILDISVLQMAADLQMNPSTITYYENPNQVNTKPAIGFLQKLQERYGITFELRVYQ